MASFWDEIGKDSERRRRTQRRMKAWAKPSHLAGRQRDQQEGPVSQAEQSRRDREDGLAEAQRRNALLTGYVADLSSVLGAVVELPPPTLRTLGGKVPDLNEDRQAFEFNEPRPAWTDFTPPEPGLFGRRRYARAVDLAQAAYDRAYRNYELRRREAEGLHAKRARHAS